MRHGLNFESPFLFLVFLSSCRLLIETEQKKRKSSFGIILNWVKQEWELFGWFFTLSVVLSCCIMRNVHWLEKAQFFRLPWINYLFNMCLVYISHPFFSFFFWICFFFIHSEMQLFVRHVWLVLVFLWCVCFWNSVQVLCCASNCISWYFSWYHLSLACPVKTTMHLVVCLLV